MTTIHVDVEDLRLKASQIDAAAERLRSLADSAYSAAEGARSYDGQFGPKVRSLGGDAHAAIIAKAEQLEGMGADLRAKADEFEQADQDWHESLARINRRGQYPLTQVQYAESDSEPPWWLIELIIGMVPFGDMYDIGKELIRLITSGEFDTLVLILAVLGLLADIGWADGPIPDPVDGANAGLALLKGLVKQIPPGPARDAIQETLLRLVRNADEAPEFFAALHTIIKHDEVLEVLTENPRTLATLLDAGPEIIETLAKNEEVAVALVKHHDVAAALFRNADHLDEIVEGGSEAVEQLLRYGDDYAARFLDAVPETGLAEVGVVRGLEVSKLADEFGVDIHVAGRWADSPADVEVRRLAAADVEDLMRTEGISELEAQLRVAEKYDIDFYQARVSSGKPEVDVFIPNDQWEALADSQKDELRRTLAETFDVDPDDVDFYQELNALDLEEYGIPATEYSPPDPTTNVPPGSIRFGSDGTIDHAPLGNLGGSGP